MDGQDASTDRSDDEGASESGWLALNDRHERGQNSQKNQHIERVEELDPPRQPEHLPLAPIRCIDLVSQREREVENDDFVEAQHPSNSPVAPNTRVKPCREAASA